MVLKLWNGFMLKQIHVQTITDHVARLCQEANYCLGQDVTEILKKAKKEEVSPLGKEILQQVLENACIAREESVPLCQDTGMTVVFIELGQDVHLTGGDLTKAINEGVRRGYQEGYLRMSIVSHPFKRKNTNDNTPAVIHVKVVPGDKLKIIVFPKGFGGENFSGLKMLLPGEGKRGVKKFVLEQVKLAGSNPCPPIIVGVGIGGTFEKAALLAKKALLRKVGEPSSLSEIAILEKELLQDINSLGIGPQGLGGSTTALAVNIEIFPCHIASLPVAVNINCSAHRQKEVIL
jgi:fumarate hydratase subunit alpha